MTDTASNANAHCKHILFFANAQATAEKNKKSLQATAQRQSGTANWTRHIIGRTEARTDNI